MDSQSDLTRTRRLIEAARAHQTWAVEQLFAKHRVCLARHVNGRVPAVLRRHVDESDLVQETIADAIRHFDAFEYRGPGCFQRWLLQILRNRLRMVHHRLARGKRDVRRDVALESPVTTAGGSAGAPALEAHEASPSVLAAAREQEDRLRRCLDDLPPDHAQVIRLAKLEHRSYASIAEIMGRSDNAVKKLLARALVTLTDAIDPSRARRR